MDIFNYISEKEQKSNAPLAERLKPESLQDFIGQKDVLGRGKLLRRAIEADRITSLILYGPPGTGKTSLAKVISNMSNSEFMQLNAVTSGVKDIRQVIEDAKFVLASKGKKTILFVDEIHRFNKSQQDALLPDVESGTVILIGATTENPYFEVNGALISRSMIYRFNKLTEDDIAEIVIRALNDKDKGLGNNDISISDDTIEFLANFSDGDARRALNTLDLAVLTTDKDENGKIVIDIDMVKECLQRKNLNYDKKGDNHYDIISAFIKSVRGSDPDAAVHYLARMLYAGESIEFIARRLIILASEDIGNADPMGLVVATNAANAVKMIGMPEARIILSQATTYLASAPKSNASYVAINEALRDIEDMKLGEVPVHLKDSSYGGAKKLGHGLGYKYPHEYENNHIKQQYLPDEMKDKVYYKPTKNGEESKLRDYLLGTKFRK